MATLTKDRARKPLAVGRPSVSYGMNAEFNNGEAGVSFRLNVGDDSGYTLRLTNAEFDQAIMRRTILDQCTTAVSTLAALEIAQDEIEKDRRDGITREYQLEKALRMAVPMLRSHMIKSEQPHNASLAYLEKVINNQ